VLRTPAPHIGALNRTNMLPDLIPASQLTQVVFVHDYLQLIFGEDVYCIYNRLELNAGTRVLQSGQPGFADALASLIGQRIKAVADEPGAVLDLIFGNHHVLRILKGVENESGPEAYNYFARGGFFVVQQNGAAVP